MGGTLTHPAIVEKARTRMNTRSLYIVYGGGETSPVITCTNPDEPTDRWIRTVGKPLDHVEVKVVDAKGNIVPVNTSGELCTRGPHVFRGYLNDDAKTKEAIRNGWYHTGSELGTNLPGILDILREVLQKELKKLLPSSARPASLSITEVVREEIQSAIQPQAPFIVEPPEEPTVTYALVARRSPPATRTYQAPARRDARSPPYPRHQE
ncbi:hypothetical protein HPB47_013522 [Ixodes persulcatus]|uniref:Uncharacterized protein n=1 Tax=Ixodes persulcatus TaxID=34615 RepID=A0AC60QYC1_IXOPE|nr:hypothetical protein HPB47_013522 [Ixodes persulcatus]